jgi:putative sigma-54 modulation protein
MEVEITARQVKIPKALRTQAEDGLERIARILGRNAHASIVFSAQKRLQIAEVTVRARLRTIVATGKASTLETALRLALEHTESQVQRDRDRRIEGKRLPKLEKLLTAPPVTRSKAQAAAEVEEEWEEDEQQEPVQTRQTASVEIAVRSTPALETAVEPRIVPSGEAIAVRAMSIEEAVKDAESRGLDLLIFHDPAGDQFVLHRSREGQLELIRIPSNAA